MWRGRTLALISGTVVSVAVFTCARRRKRPQPAIAHGRFDHPEVLPRPCVIPGLLVLLSPALYGYDFGEFFGGVWGFFTGIGSDVKDFVRAAVNKAIEFVLGIVQTVEDGIKQTINVVKGTIDIVVDAARTAAEAVKDVVVETVKQVGDAFDNFRQNLKDFLEHAWDALKDWVVENIPDWIGGAFGDAWDFLKDLVKIGKRGIGMLIDLVDDPINFIWDLIKELVKDLVQVVSAPFDFIVSEGLKILFAGFGDIVDILKKIFHILEWLADHVDDIDPTKLDDIFDISLEGIMERMERAFDANQATWERKISGWL